MGYKSVLRSVAAAQRRSEREARRRQSEFARKQKQVAKMQELERARFEVEQYENYIEVITSIHRDCGEKWHWDVINKRPDPRRPEEESFKTHTGAAKIALEAYSPSRTDRILRRVDAQREELSQALKKAPERDRQEYQKALDEYMVKHREWVELQKLSNGILENDPEAYAFALELLNPFSEISELGSEISFHTDTRDLIEVSLKVKGGTIIPSKSKTLLKSGKASEKNLTKSRFYELYQDYVCGCAIRVAREIFALLPSEMVIFTAMSDLLNTSTGHLEPQPILSVAIPRSTLDGLNINAIDPSDSMNNFVHNMKFLKTRGFKAVDKLVPSDLAKSAK